MAAATANQTSSLYRSVIEEVIKNVRDAFINEGHDEKVIQELKNAWEIRLKDSEAVKMSKNDMSLPDTSAAIYPHNTIPKSLQSQHMPMPIPSGSLVGNFQSGVDHRVREIQSQPVYSMKQHPSLSQPPIHSMPHHFPPAFPPQHPMYMNRSMPSVPPAPPRMEKLENTLPSSDDKPSKDQLPGFKYEGKRHQSDLAMLEKPHAKRSRMGQLDGTGGRGAGATGGADVIEDSTDEDDGDDLDDGDDHTDNSDLGPEEAEVRGSQGDQGAAGGVDDTAREGDEELGTTDDDETGDDQEDHFETDNMVVCQFKKVTRTRNKWRFHLKDGIMNLNGMDFVFAQATGEADW